MERRERDDRTDEGTVRRFLSDPDDPGARQALSDLFASYRGRVYLWCYRLVRDHEQALDLAQDAMLGAYRDLASFGERARFSSWLFAIAHHRCLSALRRPSLLRDEPPDPGGLVDREPGPDRELEERLDEEAVLELISRSLDPIEQEALWLRCFERVPVDDITAMLELHGASGARGVLQNARRKLKAALEHRST